MEKQLTIHDEMQLEGALVLLKRYTENLTQNVKKVVENYDATDFSEVDFLADVAYAIDNADVVSEAAETAKKVLRKMRAEVAPIFTEGKEETE